MNMWKCAVYVFLFLFGFLVHAQTCCSGGVPISGNLGLPFNDDGKSLQYSLSYDLNVLTSLKTNTEKLADNSRERTTQTYLLQLGFPVWKKLSLELLAPYIFQRREINQFNNSDLTKTNGFGDMTILARYVILQNLSWIIRSGVGLKLATGKSDLRDNGITLNADMQPGSGAYDAILWMNVNHNLGFRPSMTLNVMAIHRMTGVNDDYLGSFTYKFGNETSVFIGVADQYVLGSLLFNPSISVRYRNMQVDNQNDFELPNTGGNWIFFRPGIVIKDVAGFSISIYTEHPLYADVGGTQLTPTSRYNIGILGRINLKKDEEI